MVRRMFPGDVRGARSIGRRITDARRAGDRDKELSYRKRAESMIEQFGPDAQREIENGLDQDQDPANGNQSKSWFFTVRN
jgi:hypothetical protein